MPRRHCEPMRPISRTIRLGATGTVSSLCPPHQRWLGPIWQRLVKAMRCRPYAVALPPSLARAVLPAILSTPSIPQSARRSAVSVASMVVRRAALRGHHHGGGPQAVPGLRDGSRWRPRPGDVSPRLCRRVAPFRTRRVGHRTCDLDRRWLEATHRAVQDGYARWRCRGRHSPGASRRHLSHHRPQNLAGTVRNHRRTDVPEGQSRWRGRTCQADH